MDVKWNSSVSTSKSLDAKKNKEEGKRYGKKPEFIDTRGSNKIEIDYFHFYESLYRREIEDWISSRIARRDPFNPITYPIQQLFKDAMLDNHLQGVWNSRLLRVSNKELVLKSADGVIDIKKSALFQTRWIRDLIKGAMESNLYGYSVFFCENLNSPDRRLIEIPRENIIPERGVVLKNPLNPSSETINLKDFPNHFIYIELGPNSVGMLERIAPMTIYKRHSWASWDEFEQIFGMPLRIARTAIQTKTHKDELQQWLELMGTASYAIFDKQTDVEIKEANNRDAFNVFYQKIQGINKEISKGVVGQTMTSEDGSSQSQANVHMEIFNDITDADIQDVKDWLTDDLIPVLQYWGFDIPEGYYFDLQERSVLKPTQKILIDDVLLRNGYNIQPGYIEETYGTPLDEKEPRQSFAQTLSANKDLSHGFDEGLKDFF